MIVITKNVTKNDAAGIAFTILSRARMCAPTASTKYNVSIAVVSLASHGNRNTDSSPRAAAAFDTGIAQRISGGMSRSSRILARIGSGIAHATASPA